MIKFVKILKIMKKIIFSIIIGLLLISCKVSGQSSMLSTLYQNYTLYNTYLTEGSYIKAEKSGQKLLRGESLFANYLAGSLTGRNGLMDSCLTAFNTLYGKTHSPISFELTSVSYLDLDSLLINGVKITNFYPRDSIISWIGTAGLDTSAVESLISDNSIDSTFLNLHLQIFRDSLDITEDVKDSVLFWISDSTLSQAQIISLIQSYSIQTDSVLIHINNLLDTLDYTTSTELTAAINGIDTDSDSSWVSIIVDTANIGAIKLNDTYGSQIISGASRIVNMKNSINQYSFVFDLVNGYLYGAYPSSNDLELRLFTAPSSTAPNIIPKRSDSNTGFSWVSADKLALVGGGHPILTAEYTSSKSIIKEVDSMVVGTVDANMIYTDSINTANGWHKNIVSFNDVPSDSALVGLTSSGNTFYYSYGGLDLNVSGTPANNRLSYFTDSNTIAATEISYSAYSGLGMATGTRTGFTFTQGAGGYSSILTNNGSTIASVRNISTLDNSVGIQSSVAGASSAAFHATASGYASSGYYVQVNNYGYANGLSIANSSTTSTTNSIYISQPSNNPNLFYCANKFRIDGRGTPYIRDTSLVNYINAHVTATGTGTVRKTGTPVLNQLALWSDSTTLKSVSSFIYHPGTDSYIINCGLTLSDYGLSDTGWVAIDANGSLFSSLVQNAGFALKMSLPKTISEFLKDQRNGEVAWYSSKDGINISKNYKLTNNPTTTIQQLQAGIEISYRYIDELETKLSDIESRLSALEKKKRKGIFNFLRK